MVARNIDSTQVGVRPSHFGTRRLSSAALVVGVIVALAIAVPTIFAHTPAGPPQQAPPFSYFANATAVPSSSGIYLYNVTISSILGGNASTAWTQFFSGHRLLVTLVTPAGTQVAKYNSSNSTFQGPQSGFNASTFSSLGGWESGYGSPVVAGDTFEVTSSVALAGSYLYLYMGSTTAPHWIDGQDLLS
jgi:hypothetical protein